jgi:hypothetical protein
MWYFMPEHWGWQICLKMSAFTLSAARVNTGVPYSFVRRCRLPHLSGSFPVKKLSLTLLQQQQQQQQRHQQFSITSASAALQHLRRYQQQQQQQQQRHCSCTRGRSSSEHALQHAADQRDRTSVYSPPLGHGSRAGRRATYSVCRVACRFPRPPHTGGSTPLKPLPANCLRVMPGRQQQPQPC